MNDSHDFNDTRSAPRDGSPERSEGIPARGAEPDPQVRLRATRRRFAAEYKERIVREADACTKPGQLGALLRREGIYSSSLAVWRREIRSIGVEGLAAKKRGPAPKSKPSERELQLERENRKLQKRLAKAEAIIDFQKKRSARSPGDPPEEPRDRRRRLMLAVSDICMDVDSTLSRAEACAALEVPRASYY
ncbi:MAG: transposase [Phycisphaerae bacterium]|nr:transposase [Phycisphaerae bacterium]